MGLVDEEWYRDDLIPELDLIVPSELQPPPLEEWTGGMSLIEVMAISII